MAHIGTDRRTGKKFVRIYAGTDAVTGRVIKPQKTLTENPSQAEIDRAIESLELECGFVRDAGKRLTVGGLVEYYLDSRLLYGMSPNTVQSYRSNAKCYVYPYIGSLPYSQARPADISNLYRELLAHGGKDGTGIAAQTVKKLHAFLSGCFKTLIEDGVIEENIVAGVKTPRGSSPEAAPLTERDFATLKSYLNKSMHKTDVALLLALNTGVRRGELAGFYCVDFKASVPSIRVARGLYQVRGDGGALTYKDPKSKTSKRAIALDKDTALRLREYLHRRDTNLAELGVVETSDAPLFPHEDGSPLRPFEYYERLKRLVRELGLNPAIKLHTLRHTHATYLLESGANIKTVQERLGHSTIQTTLNIYGHVLEGRDAAAAEGFAEFADGLLL